MNQKTRLNALAVWTLMQSKGLSMAGLASILGCGIWDIWNVVNGVCEPVELDFAIRLASALNVSVAEIVMDIRANGGETNDHKN